MEEEIELQVSQGQSLIVLDAVSQRDLEVIAAAAAKWPEVILVGSAGLASALAAGMCSGSPDDAAATEPPG